MKLVGIIRNLFSTAAVASKPEVPATPQQHSYPAPKRVRRKASKGAKHFKSFRNPK